MQRRVIIMRHAKSDWDSDAPTDHSRPLNKRGRRDAPRVAKRIADLGWAPQLVISSDSHRTRETFELMADYFDPELPVRFTASLYHAGPDELAAAMLALPDSETVALALGHNPGWSAAVNWLTETSVGLTTANAALCHVEADSWKEAVQLAGIWKLEEIIQPKEL